MEISGPLVVNIVYDEQSYKRELQINFTPDFQKLSAPDRTQQLGRYIDFLRNAVSSVKENKAEQQGILTILQITEELFPHVKNDEIDLNETISVTVESTLSVTTLLSSLTQH